MTLIIVEAIRAVGEPMSLLGKLIMDIEKLMKSFNSCNTQRIGRDRNEAAHIFAKFALHVDDLCVWWDSFPAYISQAIGLINICKVHLNEVFLFY